MLKQHLISLTTYYTVIESNKFHDIYITKCNVIVIPFIEVNKLHIQTTATCNVDNCSFQYCCYDEWDSLIINEDGAAGHMFSYHPKFFKKLHEKYDLKPKKWCCSYSDNCYLYLDARPIDRCRAYFAPVIGEQMLTLLCSLGSI